MFIESKVWDGIKSAEMAEVFSKIGPSIAFSSRKVAAERSEPEYLPVSSSKHIGKVTYFNAEKGFGRIDGKTYFHVADVIDGNKAYIREGVTLAYEEGIDGRSGREKAVDIQLVKN